MKTAAHDPCRLELEAGIASSRDPANAFLPDLSLRTTTIYSPWYTRQCPVCRQKFREGDRVRICPLCGQAYHDDEHYNLRCWRDHFAGGRVCRQPRFDRFAEQDDPGCGFVWSGTLPDDENGNLSAICESPRNDRLVLQFESGLKGTWQAFGEQEVIIAKPGDPFIGHTCPWCRFEIRAGDHIVKCPCGKCNTYFHADMYRHLECWNQWNGSQGLQFCPTTGAKIPSEKLGS